MQDETRTPGAGTARLHAGCTCYACSLLPPCQTRRPSLLSSPASQVPASGRCFCSCRAAGRRGRTRRAAASPQRGARPPCRGCGSTGCRGARPGRLLSPRPRSASEPESARLRAPVSALATIASVILCCCTQDAPTHAAQQACRGRMPGGVQGAPHLSFPQPDAHGAAAVRAAGSRGGGWAARRVLHLRRPLALRVSLQRFSRHAVRQPRTPGGRAPKRASSASQAGSRCRRCCASACSQKPERTQLLRRQCCAQAGAGVSCTSPAEGAAAGMTGLAGHTPRGRPAPAV